MQMRRWLRWGIAAVTVAISIVMVKIGPGFSRPDSHQVMLAQRPPTGPSSLLEMPPWLGAAGVWVALLIALAWLWVYWRQRRWQRVSFACQEAKAFWASQAVRNVLDILDSEEYRTFHVSHPETGQLVSFEATDARLRRALRSHDQMTKTRQGLNEVLRLAEKETINPDTLAVFQRYEQEEFFIETTLRDWFDRFLSGLEYFDDLIVSGMIRTQDIKPFILYWIQLIGDRRYRRQEGSSFYDQLSLYICEAGYTGVQRLFERFGFKVLAPPYDSNDLDRLSADDPVSTARALFLAKAAYLVYEDRPYVADIVQQWLDHDQNDHWRKMTPRQYVIEVIKAWFQEDQPSEDDLCFSENFKYLEADKTDTQAFIFRYEKDIILVFRGSQQLQDWKTNFKIQMQPFTVCAKPQVQPPPGQVHRGFLNAWHSVEKKVVEQLQAWRAQEAGTRLWITGHSLGGALANMAAFSLQCQNFPVSGMYTFGQPRIANRQLAHHVDQKMGQRLVRYANNNDLVPLIPIPLAPWRASQGYTHMGQFRYFGWNGHFYRKSTLGQRWPDRLLGLLLSLRRSGIDAIDDHKMEFYIDNLQTAHARECEQAQLARDQSSPKA